jgi:transcriptional regulator with XRE-family HTH domain
MVLLRRIQYIASMENELNHKTFHDQPFLSLLRRTLVERCRKNPGYSLRAFARSLGVAPSALCHILSGKRPISKAMLVRLGLGMGLSPGEIEKLKPHSVRDTYKTLADDEFAMIADWYHYAILELTYVENSRPDPRWVSKMLGITAGEARIALDRLQKMGLLQITEGTWKDLAPNGNMSNITAEAMGAARKRLQQQMLELSLQSLEEMSMQERDHSSMTMAVHPEDFELAKQKIKEFRRQMSELFAKNPKKKRVYHLQLSLYPVTKSEILKNGGAHNE